MEIELIDFVHWVVVVPMGLLYKEIKAMQTILEHVRASRPSREEMEKYVQLAQRPTEVLLTQVLARVVSIEQQQREILNGRSPGKD